MREITFVFKAALSMQMGPLVLLQLRSHLPVLYDSRPIELLAMTAGVKGVKLRLLDHDVNI